MIEEQYKNVSSNWKVKTHHYVHKNILRMLSGKGLRGVGYLASALKIIIKLPPVNGPVIVRIGDGLVIRVDPSFDQGLETSIYETGSYESGTLFLIRKLLRPGDCFFDIGANIGLMSLVASRVVGPTGLVCSFEPVPSTYAILNYNVKLNNLLNVKSHNLALGSQKGESIIYENTKNNRGGATLVKKAPNEKGVGVSIDTLDNILLTIKDHEVRLMKIDVEGWEIEVLSGAMGLLRSASAPMVIMEYDHGSEKSKSAFNLLESTNNYQVYVLKRGKEIVAPLRKIISRDMLPAHDNIICMLPSHRQSLPDSLFA